MPRRVKLNKRDATGTEVADAVGVESLTNRLEAPSRAASDSNADNDGVVTGGLIVHVVLDKSGAGVGVIELDIKVSYLIKALASLVGLVDVKYEYKSVAVGGHAVKVNGDILVVALCARVCTREVVSVVNDTVGGVNLVSK